jgi:DNA ligase (NAD+)
MVPYATCRSITKNFKTVPHDYRMYSLDNSYSKDLIDWENNTESIGGCSIRIYL